MGVKSRVRYWVRRVRTWYARWKSGDSSALREFVYLDETSVYSLLASRLGPVAAEFTETQTNSLKSETSSELQIGPSIAKGKSGGKAEGTTTNSSQILRKVTVQSAFRDLRRMEEKKLRLRVPGLDTETPRPIDPGQLKRSSDRTFCIDATTLLRGELIEIEVELRAESVFRINAAMRVFQETIEENRQAFADRDFAGADEVFAMNRMLEQFMVGLVPLRSLVPDYIAVQQGDAQFLVHRDAQDNLTNDQRSSASAVKVVGVAERGLFWKDIRRILFSSSRYTILARISNSGLRRSWKPVKLTGVMAEISPEIAEGIENLGDNALSALTSQKDAGTRQGDADYALARHFATALLSSHNVEPDGSEWPEGVMQAPVRSTDIATQRQAFREIANRLDDARGVRSSDRLVARLRDESVKEVPPSSDPQSSVGSTEPLSSPQDLLLDVEIVAIYW